MHIALDAAQVRAARPLEATLWATLGHGSGLYARARACFKEGLALSGRQREPDASAGDPAISGKAAAEAGKAAAGGHGAPLSLSTKVAAEPTPAQRLQGECRLRWAAAILDRAARRGEPRVLPMLARLALTLTLTLTVTLTR